MSRELRPAEKEDVLDDGKEKENGKQQEAGPVPEGASAFKLGGTDWSSAEVEAGSCTVCAEMLWRKEERWAQDTASQGKPIMASIACFPVR